LDNGNPIDVEPHCGSNNHNAFMGLLKAYLRPSQEAGPGDIIAGAILGEKWLLTTDLVSIDVQQLQLRGETLPLDIAVYYTLDGTIPSKQSALYTQPFAVTIGTTVRAVVYSNNAKLFDMEECFAMTEGLHWQLLSTQSEEKLSLTATPKIICTACNPQRCLGYDATNRLVLLDTAKEKENNLWIMEEATDGAYRLLHIATQRYLSYDGSMLSLAEQAAGDNIEWNIHGDREHFDYIQHKNSARKLGVSQMRDGLFMYDKDVQEDTNFESNPAYWTFSDSI
ncbi:MAG: FN3 associated domain-containing protein, partial [Angelakisella sp.]